MMPSPHNLSTPLAYALAYAALGWHVFPVEPRAKIPVGRLVPRGHLDATTDQDTIRRWWKLAPDAGIGVSLAASGLVAIDVDPRNGGTETFEQLQAEHGPLRSEVTAYTGGGGEHHVFVLPPGMHPTLPGSLGPGIDVKCNGYIVVEPSIHPNGKAYGWEASSSPLDGVAPSPLPDWLRGHVRASTAQESPHRGTAGKIAVGGRNNYLSRRAFALKKAGLPTSMMAQAIAEINAADCDPPLEADEIALIAGGKRRIGADIVAYMATVGEQAANEGGLVLSISQLAARAEAVSWAVKGIIPSQGLGFIYGASGTFKSFLALDYALHRVYGIKWMNRKTKKSDVVYIAAEGGAGLMRRIKAWHRDRGMLWENCQLKVVIIPLTLRTESTMLREAILESGAKPGDVIVDTMSQTFTGNENSNDEVADWMRTVGLELRDALQCNVMIVHHSGHLATERPRGASAILANADYCLGVFRDEKQMIVTVVFDKIKDGERPDDTQFELAVQELGFDEDGDIITSLSARWMAPADVVEALKRETAAGRGGHSGALLSIVRPGMSKEEARNTFYSSIDSDASPEAKRQAFHRALKALLRMGIFDLRDNIFFPSGA